MWRQAFELSSTVRIRLPREEGAWFLVTWYAIQSKYAAYCSSIDTLVHYWAFLLNFLLNYSLYSTLIVPLIWLEAQSTNQITF